MPDPFTIAEFRSSDGYSWHHRRYSPASARAHVVFVHGIQSHGGWYVHSCSRLAEAGFSVSFLDRRGAGLNQRDRGDAPNFRRLIDDIAEYLQSCRNEAGPLFLTGISWGGKLAAALPCRFPGLIDGLLLLSPGLRPIVGMTWRERLGIGWSRLFSPRRLFKVPLNEPELFTATPRWQQFVHDDPLRLHRATARLLIESVRLDGYLRWKAKHISVPVLLMLAEHDRIINNARTRRFVEQLASADKQIIEYPGAHHTLEFEPDPECFLGDLIRWLENHLAVRR